MEAGPHPWVQQLLLLQLQQLALRNDLQVIVTTHSPAVLDSVPANGRIFLERDEAGCVTVRPAYRDVIQNALYGRSRDTLNLLCEDVVAEGILQGLLDVLLPDERISPVTVRIGRDTGANEFPQHAAAFRKFGQIENFIFVLDGDKVGTDLQARIVQPTPARSPQVLFLPGDSAPEVWIWNAMRNAPLACAPELGIDEDNLGQGMNRLDAVYAGAADRPGEIAKEKLRALADTVGRSSEDIGRSVARLEARREESDIQPLMDDLRSALREWRHE